jgi:hypothetical protein
VNHMRSFDPSRARTKLRLIAGLLTVAVIVFAMPVAFAGQPGPAEPTVIGAGAQADQAGGAETPQGVDSWVLLSQARGAAEARPRTGSRAGGQQPQGIPDTSGQPANMPLMIGATIVLVLIGGLFLIGKKFYR